MPGLAEECWADEADAIDSSEVAGMNQLKVLQEKEKARFAVLQASYELSGGEELSWFSMEQLAERTGLPVDRVQEAFDYLDGEGLVVPQAFGGTSGITHRGIVEFEQSLKQPDEPTEHFQVAVIQQFLAPVGSVQTGNGATANVAQIIGAPLPAEVVALLDMVMKASADLAAPDQRDLVEQLNELRAELEEASPRKSRIKAFLVTMWQVAQEAVTVAPKVLDLAEKLGHPLLPK